MNTTIERNEDLQKAIFNFTWDRLDSIKDNEVEGSIESQRNIDEAINVVRDILTSSGVENIDMILSNIADAYQYQANLFIEKAYRTGMADGLRFINNL